ncbi:TIGR02444 family protein [Rhodospirillaceae bacterium KN72]|uniref:TIGR02444 family protein n=1 Tax=Pacificispira spongiicola TaxID=2729598 RepID=A0A7Y0DY98_9PROT|nr:TIGR02444 family protein [Pacificispira spongiicola]NMM43800.1 TIGR02444 family protein [Pacificispira spongiicola]
MEKTETHAAFEAFCLDFYNRDSVESACLALQDTLDLDVVILLLCCWTGRHGAYLSGEVLTAFDASARPWRETVVTPLRKLRRRLKSAVGGMTPDMSDPFRDSVKKLELDAELLLIGYVAALLERIPGENARAADRTGVIRGNIIRYAEGRGLDPADLPRDHVEVLAKTAADRM